MVSRGSYYDDDEPVFRRYSGRGHGYPLSHDRDLHSAPSHAPYHRERQLSSHGAQSSNGQSPEQDVNAQPRRRIPVACGRCRKRKIRCSGDPGNGQPCSNCKSAGNELCQFLRVSSTEAQMKSEAADFGYDSAAAVSRLHCRMNSYGPQHASQPYTSHGSFGSDGFQYRHNSLSAYQYPVKYYGMQSYGEFADENVDYGMHASGYPILGPEQLSISYSGAGSGRGWTPGPPIPKNNSLFIEQDSTYNHGQLPYHSNNFSLRPAINPESKSLSLNGMSTSLPAPISGTDRILPYPAANRLSQSGLFLRTTESMLPGSQPGMQFQSGVINNNMMHAVKTLNNTVASENASSYLPLSSSSPESVPSSLISYGSQSHSSSQHHDNYTPGSHDGGLFQHHNGSSSELVCSYAPRGGGSHRASVTSQPNSDSSQSLPIDNGVGHLTNGHVYQPPSYSPQSSFPTPPMIDMQPTALALPRHAVSSSS